MHPIVVASELSLEFPNGRELFRGLSFTLERRVSALVGPNGVGKSTLARIVAGDLEPSRGLVLRHGPVSYFPQRMEPPGESVAEHLGFESEWSRLRERLLEGIDRDASCAALSGGQWMRVRLARALGAGYWILDEPTNDLDREGREAVLEFLRNHEGGALLVSHDRECLSLCAEVLELSNRGLSRFGMGWEEYEEAKASEREGLGRALELATRAREAARAERLEKLARQEKRNRRGSAAAAKGGMPRILVGGRKRRAQASTGKIEVATAERADEAVREAREALAALKVDPVMYADLLAAPLPDGKLVAEARGFNVRRRDWVFARDLDFRWQGSARVALKGPNGSGKSTLLKSLLGEPLEQGAETRGSLRPGNWVALYVDQRCASLDDSKTVYENVRDVSYASESEIRSGLARFLFAKDAVFLRAGQLSGGERLRAALARGLLGAVKPELLVLDEPTNNLDLANVEFLEELARQFRGALVVVSHDEVFLRNCGITEELALA